MNVAMLPQPKEGNYMRVANAKITSEQRKIGFAAPEQIHGALKQVVGWAEMSELKPSGMTFTEREFLQGLIAGFWAKGKETWAEEIENNSAALKKFVKTASAN
jgi:hypothetical protein